MTSPLKATRERKLAILQEMIQIECRMLTYPKKSLDLMDMRIMKKISRKLKELDDRGKP